MKIIFGAKFANNSKMKKISLGNIYLEMIKTQTFHLRRRSSYDPIDHFAQFLWAHNTRYPDRIDKYNNIHDMEWVQKYLRQNPRSFFPFHLVWNENFAAIKIQSYMRGYWVRKQENIQEVRKFWKQLKDENKSSGTSLSRRFYTIDEDYKSQFEK
ncbi:hypothetical protein WA026_018898 [Henosepilachna vigintioctopunctata]|uniref:Uncharacterized protein n=1 Tax=Henosepilachna vigintioctopunctata TaxID=420089 RepID=A0AAW1UNF3_9CUCU